MAEESDQVEEIQEAYELTVEEEKLLSKYAECFEKARVGDPSVGRSWTCEGLGGSIEVSVSVKRLS